MKKTIPALGAALTAILLALALVSASIPARREIARDGACGEASAAPEEPPSATGISCVDPSPVIDRAR